MHVYALSTIASLSKKKGTPIDAIYPIRGLGLYSYTMGSTVTAPISNLIGATD